MYRNILLIIILLVNFANVFAGENSKNIDYKKPLSIEILAEKNYSELWLMRNEIYARHGRPFMNYELHNYFMSSGWYRPNDKYNDKMLSKTEMANISAIQKKEEECLTKNYINKNGTEYINPENIANIFQYSNFSAEENEKLSKNGFITLSSEYKQLFHLYENNDYLGIPSFITTDAVLQLYHLIFDMTLRKIEQEYLIKKLEIVTATVMKENRKINNTTANKTLKQASAQNLIYYGISYYLLNPDKIGNDTSHVYKKIRKEIGLCESHQPWIDSPVLMRKFDYSQFIPRGHYTRSDELKKYFKSMMWLGLAGISIESDSQLVQSLLTTHILYNASSSGRVLIDIWKDIYEPTVFYVGLSDDLGPQDFKEAMDQVYGNNSKPEDYLNAQKLPKIRELLKRKFKEKTKIVGHGDWGTQGPQFRFMGQRFVPDSYVFDRLTVVDREKKYFRWFPNGLDVMAVFGSQSAKEIMLNEEKSSWEKWPLYPKELDKITFEYSKYDEKQWKYNLYYNWLWCLKALIETKSEQKLPFFMTTEGWKRKSLNTALGSWAELRHNTILYAKQSCGAECGQGGDSVKVWVPEPPKGYVEPNIEFYTRLIELMDFTRSGLKNRDMLGDEMDGVMVEFRDAVKFLLKVSTKEIGKQTVTLTEYEQIQKFGSLLDNLTLRTLTIDDRRYDWYMVEGPDKNMPVIADVHTANSEALEVGVGLAHDIYVIVEIDGRLKLTRGAMFSYYEFPWPANDRLTDEKWQDMLQKNMQPALPRWSDYYRSNSKIPRNHLPLYKPKSDDPYQGAPKWKTTPGWMYIYYETGC